MGGPSSTVVTACATGAQAIGDGFHAIKFGQAPLMIAGSTESTSHPLFQAGFAAMRALVTDSNDNPDGASRPFDASRAGFVLGEGAGMVVLEELEHARARGARILAEIAGLRDLQRRLPPDRARSRRARARPARSAARSPMPGSRPTRSITSTPTRPRPRPAMWRRPEAIHIVFGERAAEIPVTSIKGAIGHCMAAAGALETITAMMTIVNGTVPPTRNYPNPDPEIKLDIVGNVAREGDVTVMTKHSFGLGGQNACLVLRKHEA